MTRVAIYDRPPAMRGDTLAGWSVEVEVNSQPQEVESARLQLRTSTYRLVYDWPVAVSGSTVSMQTVDHDVTAEWPPGTLIYDLELTLADGRVVTWLTGKQVILRDVTV